MTGWKHCCSQNYGWKETAFSPAIAVVTGNFQRILLPVILKERAVKGCFLFLFSSWYMAEREESMEPEPDTFPAVSMSAGRVSHNLPFIVFDSIIILFTSYVTGTVLDTGYMKHKIPLLALILYWRKTKEK